MDDTCGQVFRRIYRSNSFINRIDTRVKVICRPAVRPKMNAELMIRANPCPPVVSTRRGAVNSTPVDVVQLREV